MKTSWKQIHFLLLAILIAAFAVAQPPDTVADGSLEQLWGENYSARALNDPKFNAALLQKSLGSNLAEATRMLSLLRWNGIAINTTGLDHTPVGPGENRVFGEQLGPHRASRAMAIVHMAIFEVVNAITRSHSSYIGLPSADPRSSMEAAIAQSAHDTLASLYPSHLPSLDAKLRVDLALIPPGVKKNLGIALGRSAAQAILAARQNDGSNHAELRVGIDYFTSNLAGAWRQDPISQVPLALGAHWSQTRPFVMTGASQFRIPPPPAMTSPEYTAAYNEVLRVGGDGITTPTQRTADQSFIGVFWAYDGTPSLCAPPRLYNQVTVQIALQQFTRAVDLARLLALVNVAMADTGIAAWESKYHYDFWRPIGGVREADVGTGPTGAGDGNADTHADLNFMPLGAPASNLAGPNFTPPFPAYPSGHAAFGGALFETLRLFYGRDNVPFVFISDEFNGSTVDNQGNIRPFRPRVFSSFSQAEEENGQSRIYLGIHWSFDKTRGIDQGRRVANYVYQNVFRPLP